MKFKINTLYWLFPILYFLMVWLTMRAPEGGTDFLGQIYRLECAKNQSIDYFTYSLQPMLYDYIYSVLYSFANISPRFYIATLSFVYFALIFNFCKKEANRNYYPYLSESDLGKIVLYACLCYSPLFICIARFHFAMILVVSGLLMIHYNSSKVIKLIGIAIMSLAFLAHEGITILYGIVLLGWCLEYFWLSRITNNRLRNIIIAVAALILLLLGPMLFPLITNLLGGFGFLNEHYTEVYAQQNAGDGAYLLVLILSLFGSMLSLYVTTLYDKKNNWITAICISGLFVMCFLFNQKFFYVQRIFMFMPIFMGLSCVQVMGTLPPGKKRKNYVFLLLSVPTIYLCQLVIQRGLFFGN